MPGLDEIWVPLVDEPIGEVVGQIEAEDAEIRRLVDSPRRLLAFRTFAYIRVGLVLGQLLVDHEIGADDGPETWVERLLKDPVHRRQVASEVRAVAEEVAADPSYADEDPVGPDDAARERFRAFAKQQLGAEGT